MHERAGINEGLLSPLEREVLLGAAARDAVAAGFVPPFRLRAGLIGEMLAFYDALCGQQRSIDTFERIVIGELEPRTEIDRGAERLLRQTKFLVAAFRAFEDRVASSGKIDERLLRGRLLQDGPGQGAFRHGYSHLIVTAGDRTADPAGGVFPADVDLMMRLPNVDTIHLAATRAQLAAGLGERFHDLIPELEETDADDGRPGPRLMAPETEEERLHFVSRDREEELRAVARWIKHEARRTVPPPPLDRVAVVFKRPLPYIYLARTVFGSAGIEHQAADALPLASEPIAAVLDLVIACVESRFARGPLVALLRTPHLDVPSGGSSDSATTGSQEVKVLPKEYSDDVEAFDRRLAESGYLGNPDALATLAESWEGPGKLAAGAAAALARELDPLREKQAVSAHAAAISSFLERHGRFDISDESVRSRHLRARAAVLDAVERLRRASLEFDDPVVELAAVASTLRRWIESQTFSPRLGTGGVQFVDAAAARYGSFDAVFLAGLAEGDWPEASGRNIFYPAFLLSQLGWPPEHARLAAERAAFADLLRLPADRVRVSAFTLEDDSIVNPSPLLEELGRPGLAVVRVAEPGTLVFTDEALAAVPPTAGAVEGEAGAWLALRLTRSPAADPRFHGVAGPGPRRVHTVTAIDQFLQCPFKYFAGKVLNLPDEVVDEPSRTPRAKGQFVHELFFDFFQSWQRAGGTTITADTLGEARAHFAAVAERRLAALPAAEAGLERLRLLGSVGTQGLGEVVLAAEAARATPVRERLLEYALEGEFLISGGGASRRIRLRGKADRVDLLADGRFRLIDYKNGKLPEPGQTIQLPIYVVCIEQQLERTRKERWEVAEAGYIAFGDRRPDRPVITAGPEAATRLADGQARLLDAVERIDRGEFPPRPATPRLCSTCAYASVCRKDFVDAD